MTAKTKWPHRLFKLTALLWIVSLAIQQENGLAFVVVGNSKDGVSRRTTTTAGNSPLARRTQREQFRTLGSTTRAFSSKHGTEQPADSAASYALIDPRVVAQRVIPSVALVTPIGVRNSTSRGSGFVVEFDEDYENGEHKQQNSLHLLTAAHVAVPGHRLQVTFPSEPNVTFSARVLGRNVQNDLALLRVDCEDESSLFDKEAPLPLTLLKEDVTPEAGKSVGTPVFSLGYPSGGVVGTAMTSGIVCASARGTMSTRVNGDENNQTRFVVTNAAMAGGMSGGPLVDSHGQVLGVNALINMELRALGNYAVDVAEIHDFLNELAKENSGSTGEGTNDEDSSSTASFRVFLYNDRFNKRERVSTILKSVAKLRDDQADAVMMEAHSKGRSVICELQEAEEARNLCDALRQEDILVEVEQV